MRTKLGLVAAWVCVPLWVSLEAGPSVADYLASVPDQPFRLTREVATVDAAAQGGPFDTTVLQEAQLISRSTWTGTWVSAPVRLEVFETLTSVGAYSLYQWRTVQTAGDEGTTLPLEVGNRWLRRQGFFWRGPYFFQVSGDRALPSEAFESLANHLIGAIELDNLLPVTVSHLPETALAPGSLRFYLGSGTLSGNSEFPKALLPEINRTKEVEVAYGKVGAEGDGLFLIGYPTVALAQDSFIRLQQRMEEVFSAQGYYMKRTGVLVCLYSGPEPRAAAVLAGIAYKPTVRWLRDRRNTRQETVTFFGLVTKAILGTGAFIALLLGAGVAVGLVRYEVIRRFPGIYRGKEMTRLHLD
ncbi:MAG: hypothetical protein Kow001_12160 [Acidobacteriota bacterium]